MRGPGVSRRGWGSLALLLLGTSTLLPAADNPFSVWITPSYFSGDYGTGTSTSFFYVPFEFRWDFSRARLKLVIPYLSVSSAGNVIFTGSGPSGSGPGGSGSGGNGPGHGHGPAPENVGTSQSGLGDVRLAADLYLLEGTDVRPWISLTPFVKLGTADESKGLGTGENDYGATLGFVIPAGARWRIYADAGYQVTGDPPGVDFRNVRILGGGIGRKASSGALWQVYVEDRNSIIQGDPDLRDVMAGVRFGKDPRTFGLYVFKGLSSTAEDWGASLALGF